MSHAFYIWVSYGVTFALLALEVLFLARRAKKSKVDQGQQRVQRGG